MVYQKSKKGLPCSHADSQRLATAMACQVSAGAILIEKMKFDSLGIKVALGAKLGGGAFGYFAFTKRNGYGDLYLS